MRLGRIWLLAFLALAAVRNPGIRPNQLADPAGHLGGGICRRRRHRRARPHRRRKVSEVLGQQIIIENVGGAGGMVGSARVAKSPPDGYTIVMGTRADAINQTLYKKPAYNLPKIWCRSC